MTAQTNPSSKASTPSTPLRSLIQSRISLWRVLSSCSLSSILFLLFAAWNLLYCLYGSASWILLIYVNITMAINHNIPTIPDRLHKLLLAICFFALIPTAILFVKTDYRISYIVSGVFMHFTFWISNMSDNTPLFGFHISKQLIVPILLFIYLHCFWDISYRLHTASNDLQILWGELWSSCMPTLNFEALGKMPFLPVSVTLFTGCTVLLTWAKNTPYPNWNVYNIHRLGLAHTYMMAALSILCILLFSMTTGSYRISLLCLVSLLLLDITSLLFAHTMSEDFVRKKVVKKLYTHCFERVTTGNSTGKQSLEEQSLEEQSLEEQSPKEQSLKTVFSDLSEFSDTIISNITDESKVIFAERQAKNAVCLYSCLVDYVSKHKHLSEIELQKHCITVGFAHLGHARNNPATSATIARYSSGVFTELIKLTNKNSNKNIRYIILGVAFRKLLFDSDQSIHADKFDERVVNIYSAVASSLQVNSTVPDYNLINKLIDLDIDSVSLYVIFSIYLSCFSNGHVELTPPTSANENVSKRPDFRSMKVIFTMCKDYLYTI